MKRTTDRSQGAPDTAPDELSSELVALADMALYTAKAAGKDRACADQDRPNGSASVTPGGLINEQKSGSR